MSTVTFVAPLSSVAYYAAAKQFYLKIWLEEDLSYQEKVLEARRRKVSVRVPASENNRSNFARQLNTQEKIQVTIDPTTKTEGRDKYQGTISLYQGDNIKCVRLMPIC